MWTDREAKGAVEMAVRAMCGGLGIVLPERSLTPLGLGEGDMLSVVETADGLRLVRRDTGSRQQMDAARAIMRRRRGALRRLAEWPGVTPE